MNDRQALVNVLKNIKGKCDTQIALLGTRVFVQTFSFEKAKSHCLELRQTITLADLLNKE